MRVYEFSKEYNISNKEVLQALQDVGFEVESHMAILTPEQIEYLGETFEKEEPEESQPRAARKGKILVKKAIRSEGPEKDNVEALSKKPKKHTKKVFFSRREQRVESLEKKVQQPLLLTLESMSVGDVAERMHQPVTDVIMVLLRMGVVATKNQFISEQAVEKLAAHYEIPIEKPAVVEDKTKAALQSLNQGDLKERPPVVVVVGHVDHGKTTLLDYIRKTRVASREKGGITQHLGAYAAHTSHGNVIFIDTPGHEAFSKMRVRGVRAADIAVLVVAADDSVMPQTIEALKHVKEMGVPIIVAINKIDKVEPSRLEAVKRDLSKHDLLAEEWGGQVVIVPVSAKEGTGVDQLLDMIILQSQMQELKADFTQDGKGYILESKLERGRGSVATLLCRHGQVNVGDYFTCGTTVGKVTAMFDSFGKAVRHADAKMPVQVVGFDDLPEAGSYFEVISKEQYMKTRATLRDERKNKQLTFSGSGKNVLTCIIKTDTDSSKEALLGSLQKLSKKIKHEFNVIHAGVGDVTESDVMLATNTGSSLIVFHAKVSAQAKELVRKYRVPLYQYDIIYKLLEALEAVVESEQEVVMVRTKIGEAEVRKVFDVKNIGVIAGCYVKEGIFSRDGFVVAWRGKEKIGEGKIRSLQRDKKTVKEVHSGFECGFIVQDIDSWQEGDRAECFIDKPAGDKKKTK
jgi:translation initiation factor IF-2